MDIRNIKKIVVCIVLLLVIGAIVFFIYVLTYKDKDEKETVDTITAKEQVVVEVDTMTLYMQTFQKQILCNGKLTGIRRAELTCPKTGEILQSVNVKNGQRVSVGTVLAVADTRDKKVDLEKAKRDLEKARVELQDKLISLGYDGEEKNVPADVLHRAEVTSGYYTARYALQSAQTSLSDCRILAPFSGRVADLQARAHQRGDKLCTLIDDSFFDVEFQILEAELISVNVGTQVKVSPFVDEQITLTGSVTEINPTIDSKGLVTIKARIRNTSDKLLDGMNVKVIIENSVPNMYVVPKEAVVERDGYHVIFVYDKQSHHAIWTYVDILYSNLASYAITGCERKNTTLNKGDIVITSGNLNLADDTEVKVVSSKE